MTRRPIRTLLVVFAATALAGCGGAEKSLDIGMDEAAVDIVYGEQGDNAATPEPRSSGAGLAPSTAPGFIVAPVGLLPPGASRPAAAAPCAAQGTNSVREQAPAMVTTPPRAGRYPFRRTGSFVSAPTVAGLDKAKPVTLSDRLTRQVGNVETRGGQFGAPSTYRFDVTETSPGVATTTSYLVEQGREEVKGSGGLSITRIATTRADGTVETFNPVPAVRIMDLPAEPTRTSVFGSPVPPPESSGVDPLTGASIKVVYATKFRDQVNACGTVLDTWQVAILPDSSYRMDGERSYSITGTFNMAPQLGGLIVSDDITLEGTQAGGEAFRQHSAATINRLDPERAP